MDDNDVIALLMVAGFIFLLMGIVVELYED